MRAIYNHARKTNRSLPPSNPVDAIDWNEEKRRDTGMGASDLKGRFLELAGLNNPIRREFHLFRLLSGSRPAALQEIRPDRIDFRRRTLHISKPKGGKKRAFDIPLSRQMVLCLKVITSAHVHLPSFRRRRQVGLLSLESGTPHSVSRGENPLSEFNETQPVRHKRGLL